MLTNDNLNTCRIRRVTAELFDEAALAWRAFDALGAAPGSAAHPEIAAQPPLGEALGQRPSTGQLNSAGKVAQGAGPEVPAAGAG